MRTKGEHARQAESDSTSYCVVNEMLMEQIRQLHAQRPDDEFRLAIFGRPTGPWHPDKETAERYAVKRKLASYDAGLGITFMDVSASFDRRRKRER